MENLSRFLSDIYNVDVLQYDATFLEMALNKRMLANGCDSVIDYRLYLENNQNEASLLIDSLNISFSMFFRNPLTYAYLEQVLLPVLMERKKKENNKEIRIWSAACAAGQEAYSVAMLCDEILTKGNPQLSYRIFATDSDPDEIQRAQQGVYNIVAVENVSLRRIQNYFLKQDDFFSITPVIKQMVNFSTFDLLDESLISPPASIYGDFDIIFCCNLLFYYKPEYRTRILEKMERNLAPNGFLITGETERETLVQHCYQEVFVNSAIFNAKGHIGSK
ncbi:CheR family methyltransferase [Microbacter margulisiae]|uniref:Chemotaxis methyl-accepting protein methylase n=1 Tax=Microbacter margulisiae TaxID=1350067 RepID=A0A7W5H342_9PORP|nr:protein-glutamate O-methyltransferase CheR [Microbacter margulisiae]MBB3188224.1 chemotaxis methyl-accepting protein methylase [Microbacter margulisiae]